MRRPSLASSARTDAHTAAQGLSRRSALCEVVAGGPGWVGEASSARFSKQTRLKTAAPEIGCENPLDAWFDKERLWRFKLGRAQAEGWCSPMKVVSGGSVCCEGGQQEKSETQGQVCTRSQTENLSIKSLALGLSAADMA